MCQSDFSVCQSDLLSVTRCFSAWQERLAAEQTCKEERSTERGGLLQSCLAGKLVPELIGANLQRSCGAWDHFVCSLPLHLPAKSMQSSRELANEPKPTVSRFPRSLLWLQLAVQTWHGCVWPLLLQTPRPIPFSCCQHQSEALFALRGPFAGSDTQLWSLFVLMLGKPL